MRKLLSAGYDRLKRDKVFWAAMVILLLYAVIYMLNGCRQATSKTMSEYNYSLDNYYFHYALLIGMFCSVVTGMFLGPEYSEGTLRNKIIVGHTRLEVYLSNLILSFSASLLLLAMWLIGALVGVPTLGYWKMGEGVLIYLAISVCYLTAFSAIYTFIGMLVSHKAVAEVGSLLLFFALLLMGSAIYEALQQPEFTNQILITAEEGMKMSEPTPNPSYIAGTKREIYQFLVDFLPTGQCIQMFDLKVIHPLEMILSSLSITAVVTATGIFLFRRKNLN